MNAPSVDIRDMLEAESSLGLVFGDNLFIGKDPTTPQNMVTIFDTYGRPPQLTLGGQEEGNYYYPSIQIRVRSVSYQLGWNLIYDIMTSLHGRAQETWNGTLYTVIYCSSGPALLDWDDNGLVRFIVNFNLQRR
jgi:hypothetical protein